MIKQGCLKQFCLKHVCKKNFLLFLQKFSVMKTKYFTFGETALDDNFIDRTKETARLTTNLENGINTILVSPRRWGKSSLVEKVARSMNNNSKEIKVVLIDAFLCRDDVEFLKTFSTEVIKQTSTKWEEWANNAKHFLSGLGPKISFGTDPVTDFSIALDYSDKELTMREVLDLPQKIALKHKCSVVVCIDEFQQIAEFTDSLNFQKKLRSYWQRQDSVSYCLYGSKKHILAKMFSKQSMPFYKFGDMIFLKKIETAYWIDYITRQFKISGKQISEEYAAKICETVENHSSYVQQLAWLVWLNTDTTVDENSFEEGLKDLLQQSSALFYRYLDSLTQYQINFLNALSDGVNSEFTKTVTLTKYNLGTASNIKRIKDALEDKELIDIDEKTVSFNDPVFKIWFRKRIS
jgi:hypothetical protein